MSSEAAEPGREASRLCAHCERARWYHYGRGEFCEHADFEAGEGKRYVAGEKPVVRIPTEPGTIADLREQLAAMAARAAIAEGQRDRLLAAVSIAELGTGSPPYTHVGQAVLAIEGLGRRARGSR